MTNLKAILLGTAGAIALTGAAMAQTTASATTELNVRSGPGPNFEVIGAIPADGQVTVNGCTETGNWCQVTMDGTTGWSYAQYLTSDYEGQRVVVVEQREALNVPVTTYDGAEATGVVTGAAGGAVAGALIGGPVGAAIGGVAGAAIGGGTGDALSPDDRVVTYVRDNQIDPVYLDGEVVVGAGVPDTVQLREIPDYEYQYAYVNGQPVLIEPSSRQIVYVVR